MYCLHLDNVRTLPSSIAEYVILILFRYTYTGILEARSSQTASCACPGGAKQHDLRICRHLRYENRFRGKKRIPFTVEWY